MESTLHLWTSTAFQPYLSSKFLLISSTDVPEYSDISYRHYMAHHCLLRGWSWSSCQYPLIFSWLVPLSRKLFFVVQGELLHCFFLYSFLYLGHRVSLVVKNLFLPPRLPFLLSPSNLFANRKGLEIKAVLSIFLFFAPILWPSALGRVLSSFLNMSWSSESGGYSTLFAFLHCFFRDPKSQLGKLLFPTVISGGFLVFHLKITEWFWRVTIDIFRKISCCHSFFWCAVGHLIYFLVTLSSFSRVQHMEGHGYVLSILPMSLLRLTKCCVCLCLSKYFLLVW